MTGVLFCVDNARIPHLPRDSAHEIDFALQSHKNRGRVPRFLYCVPPFSVGRGALTPPPNGNFRTSVFCEVKTQTRGKTLVLRQLLEDYNRRADRHVVVDPVDVVLLHTDAAVRYGVAAAEVVFLIRIRRAQARMERIAGVGVEADDRANGIGARGPACLKLVGDCGDAGRGRGICRTRADDKASSCPWSR